MGKSKVREGVSEGDRKAFSKYLADDEELVLATGFGSNYLRHRFCYYLIFPGGIGLLLTYYFWHFKGMELGYALLFGLVIASIIAYVKTTWLYHSHRYLLTTRRLIIKQGFFAVKLTTALYDKITHIEVDQGFMDRLIMHHGNVIINTAGSNKDEIKIQFVDAPIEFKNLLERLINREREQFGRSTGPVVTVEGELVD